MDGTIGSAAAVLAPRVAEALGGLARVALEVRHAGPAVGVPVALAGLVAVVAGERVRRLTAAAGGALVGILAALAAGPWIETTSGLSRSTAAIALAVTAAAGAALWPPLFAVLAGALGGALLGVHVVVGGHAWLGAVLGGAAVAGLCLVGARSVAVVLAAIAGGVALGMGLLAVLGSGALGAELAARPVALVGFGLVVGIAGAAWQLGREAPGRAGKGGKGAPGRLE